MPILSGQKGAPGVLGMPGRVRALGDAGRQFEHSFGKVRFRSPRLSVSSVFITGVTRDSSGTPLAGATVQLFRSWDDVYIGETISDGSGNFSVRASGSGTFYIVAYLAGAPDLAGTTVNTLIPA